jgi:hypothetical protein
MFLRGHPALCLCLNACLQIVDNKMEMVNAYTEGNKMKQTCSIIENDRRTFYHRMKGDSLPVTFQEFLLIEHKGINYYIVDLKKIDINNIMDIIEGCDAVESECWNAQEDFYDYIQKCDFLSYAVVDGRIIGFDAVTIFHHGKICLISNDETMVLKEFCNRNIAAKLVFSTLRWFLKNRDVKDVKHFVFMSISCNPRIVNGYYRHRYIQKLFDSSFKASDELIDLMEAYRKEYNIALVDQNYPFCLKNIFPGSNTFDPTEKRFQFSDEVKRHMPENFDHMKRGDAFAFLVKISSIPGHILVFFLMLTSFGKKFLFSK